MELFSHVVDVHTQVIQVFGVRRRHGDVLHFRLDAIQLRSKVIHLLRIDTVAYVRFASVYKNFQAADDFDKFVSELRPSKSEE